MNQLLEIIKEHKGGRIGSWSDLVYMDSTWMIDGVDNAPSVLSSKIPEKRIKLALANLLHLP
jgi:hypothetical protein